MKYFITIALLGVSLLASAQPNHYKNERHNNKRHHNNHKNDYKKGRYIKKQHRYKNDYHYRVEREMRRYDFLRLSNTQQAKLQVSLNFLIQNNYNNREYERRLNNDLYNILSRQQYESWKGRAYNTGNTFIFNFGG